MIQPNRKVYGVENNIQFIHGDALEIFEKLKVGRWFGCLFISVKMSSFFLPTRYETSFILENLSQS